MQVGISRSAVLAWTRRLYDGGEDLSGWEFGWAPGAELRVRAMSVVISPGTVQDFPTTHGLFQVVFVLYA